VTKALCPERSRTMNPHYVKMNPSSGNEKLKILSGSVYGKGKKTQKAARPKGLKV